MPCTVSNPCGGVLYEDVTVTRDLRSEGVHDRKIFSCLNGHHLVVGSQPTSPGEEIKKRKRSISCKRHGGTAPCARCRKYWEKGKKKYNARRRRGGE